MSKLKAKISDNQSKIIPWLLLLVLACIWGSSFILIKKSLVYFSITQVASVRLFTASIFFVPFVLLNLTKIKQYNWKYIFISGLIGSFFPSFLFALAGKNLDSAISGALNSITPLFTLLVGSLLFDIRVSTKQVVGLIVGFIGSLLLILKLDLFFSQHSILNIYCFCVVIGSFFYALNVNFVKKNLSGIPSLLLTACVMISIGPLATLVLFSDGTFLHNASQPAAFWPLVFSITLGVFGTGLATVLFNKLLQMTTAVFVSSVTYFISIVAVAWGYFDNEKIRLQHILGIIIIFVGVFIVNKKKK